MRSDSMMPAHHVRQARLQVIEQGVNHVQGIDELVARSWLRSSEAGLTPLGRLQCDDNLGQNDLSRLRQANHELVRHSEPVMEFLFEHVRDSRNMVILADAQGILMHTMGDLDFLSKAERVALKCGATWAERQRGTNAIGTALAERREVEIHGAEHYLDRNGFLTCAASPIYSAQGQLLGILDISGDQRARHPHTLGLVSTAARMIENSLLLASSRHWLLLQLHHRPEGLDSVAVGLLAFSEDGWLVGGNRKGLDMLQLAGRDLNARAWHELFDADFEHWLERRRSPSAANPKVLRTCSGQGLFARVIHQAGPKSTVLRSHTTPQPHSNTPAPPVPDALDKLDTGDARWKTAADKARRVIDKSIPLLIQGESGVGKEWLAKAVHECSARRDKPFVAVNCAALPESLIEAELFGYVPGAFTGAQRQGSPGRLRQAHGGTLFLDEIGDMPLNMQTRLLRVLQERQVTPLGSSSPIPVDFVLICASHRQLSLAVEQGQFRADLYYRINGLTLRLPSLRERTDFQTLTQRILQDLAPDRELQIDPDLYAALSAYAWPGNLRQLGQILRTAVALLDEDERLIGWSHMPDDFLTPLERSMAISGTSATNLQEVSMRAIHQALENARGNVSAAARLLGISRQTLYRKLHPTPH